MRQIALIGGSGFIGRHIAHQLTSQDLQLVISTRSSTDDARLAELQVLPNARLAQCSRLDLGTLTTLLTGCEAAVSMAGILHGNREQFYAVHAELPARIVAACKAAGVRRLVHISALGAAADAPSYYQRSKAAGEQAVIDSGLDWTILRPSVVYGRGDNFLTLFARLSRRLPLILLAGARTRFQPIWVEDVAQAVTRVLTRPATIGQTLDLVGPRRYALAELVRFAGQCSSHPRPIIPIPLALGMLLADALALLPGQPLMSRDNLRSLQCDNVSDTGFPVERLGFASQPLEAVSTDWLA